ncbi:hypothetical protein YK48G_23420 [Lentilactobacillus fungorum]|uniref:SCP domain-containing protein n=1 Tax=Lentilactobacillus fungorum TaxID=2201250 RepID=A0ABQ3W151_9LACO|nr:CAP domain-containing protein [Lentilactobacillus fungorum]GHP14917.1 hypothetical protein YK48G_23420 [Lentilactobacillus fungorum]
MQSIKKLLISLGLSLGVVCLSPLVTNAQTIKSMTVHYVSTTGQQIRTPLTYHRANNGVSAFGNGTAYSTTGYTTAKGYVKKVKGYVPYKIQQDYTYSELPNTLTVKYIKESTLARRVEKQYLKQINAYRATKKLKAFKHNKGLKAKAIVRSKELWQKTSHTRPNGQSYNASNSGYAEVMAVLPAYFLPTGIATVNTGLGAMLVYNQNGLVSYKKTAQTASNELLTCDQEHRDTELNTWATYSEPAFSFHADGSGMMAQLFELKGARGSGSY